MRAIASAVMLPLLAFGSVSANAQGAVPPGLSLWQYDPFYKIITSYERAELMYRRFSNRLCSFAEGTPGVFGAHREMRADLDSYRDIIDENWPGRRKKTYVPFAKRELEPISRCDDEIAAREAFGAASMAVEMVEFVLDTWQRERSSSGKD